MTPLLLNMVLTGPPKSFFISRMAKIWFLVVFNLFSLKSPGQSVDTVLINKHLHAVINTPQARTYQNIESLNQVAHYIDSTFRLYTDSVRFQAYRAIGKTYKNVVATFCPEKQKRIIIGAHYDVCGNQDGADDNASGIVGLLELARLLEGVNLNYRVDLVAYTLEEPPFFRSENMGSYVHAKSLHDANIAVLGMICLEMIGYFADEPGSQHYPLNGLKLFYGDKGDFITTVKKLKAGRFARKFAKAMKNTILIPSRIFQGPKRLAGLDFSDHQNYWHFKYSSVMITNTAFYRNANYHEQSDRIETLDINRMGATIQTIYGALLSYNAQRK